MVKVAIVAIIPVMLLLQFSMPSFSTNELAHEEWSFSTDEAFDLVAASLRVNAQYSTTCFLHAKLSTVSKQVHLPDGGFITKSPQTLLVLFEQNGEWTFMFFAEGGMPVVGADIAGEDGSELFEDLSMWGASAWTTRTFAGTMDITIVAHDLAPNPESGSHPHSIEFFVDCDRPVTTNLYGDEHVHIITPRSSESGNGVWTEITGGQRVRGKMAGIYETHDVRFRSYATGDQLLTIDQVQPDGETLWLIHPFSDTLFISSDSGPGEYSVEANRFSYTSSSTFWSYLAGFHEVGTLDQIKGLPSPASAHQSR